VSVYLPYLFYLAGCVCFIIGTVIAMVRL